MSGWGRRRGGGYRGYGRGRGQRKPSFEPQYEPANSETIDVDDDEYVGGSSGVRSREDLRSELRRINGRGYKAYKDIRGAYTISDGMTLYIDYVQGDPFAAPSKARVRLSQSIAGFPDWLISDRTINIAARDFVTRNIAKTMHSTCGNPNRGTGKSGMIFIDSGGQEILERTSVILTSEFVECRLSVGLPANGRRVLGDVASQMLLDEIPMLAAKTLKWGNIPQEDCILNVRTTVNAESIRSQLHDKGLVAFVADGSILPRASGISDRPLNTKKAKAFTSPAGLRVSFNLPYPVSRDDKSNIIHGMGIPKGVTLVLGGGYHGKSTLLQAIQKCVYCHIPRDGREYVVTCPGAVKIRAEDGRRVENVNISPFINNLPLGISAEEFSTDDGSGSTSQAANILEALEVGCDCLLLDEDTSATNFMVRDARMQLLVAKENEPITPFVDRVSEMYTTLGVSTILVMGGNSDYFEHSDNVIMMKEFEPHDVKEAVNDLVRTHKTERTVEVRHPLVLSSRVPLDRSFDTSRGRRDVKVDARGLKQIGFGSDNIQLDDVEQIVDHSQTRAIAHAIVYLLLKGYINGKNTMKEIMAAMDNILDNENGLETLDPFHREDEHPGEYARFRRYELAAAINRLRTVEMKH